MNLFRKQLLAAQQLLAVQHLLSEQHMAWFGPKRNLPTLSRNAPAINVSGSSMHVL